ncbi:MAG: shikimate dehydrogenase family protein [Flavobacteriaceae bacterium]
MGKADKKKSRFGLVGKNISYSFSRSYFTAKFEQLGLGKHSYENFDLSSIREFKELIQKTPSIKGLNITIPYKEAVIPYLDRIDPQASEIGAVNTVQFGDGGLVGYNTDAFGFRESLRPMLNDSDKYALILGTGGASKAVAYVLDELGIEYKYVSRNPVANQLSYTDLNSDILNLHTVLINCTPLGTFPQTEQKPDLPYEHIGERHLLFDLIYNPAKTLFLKEGELKGSRIINGLKMLELQAEKAWEIWNL